MRNSGIAGARRIVATGGRRKLGCTSTRWAERQRVVEAEANRIAGPNAALPHARGATGKHCSSSSCSLAMEILSLGGVRGIFSFEKENIPLIRVPYTVWGKPRSAFALPFYPAREKIRKGHLSPFSFFVHCYNGLPLREVCHGHLHRKRLRV